MKQNIAQSKTLFRWMFASLAAALLLVGAFQARLAAQESLATPLSKVERKNRAPVSQEMLRVKIPRAVEAKLKNGLTVLIIEDRRAPYINMQLYINGAGALFEPANLAGLASTTAQMLREGSKSKTSLQIAQAIDRLGASISAGAAFGSPDAVLSAAGLSDNFDAWFNVAVDLLLNPSFPADELEKLK
ncbi:MAG TPA: insulinase family protein, partial [Candidatus Limnocylindria bacterium]|nr:insulinase family protein [Candidatus Limnocylindria bacterium]